MFSVNLLIKLFRVVYLPGGKVAGYYFVIGSYGISCEEEIKILKSCRQQLLCNCAKNKTPGITDKNPWANLLVKVTNRIKFWESYQNSKQCRMIVAYNPTHHG